MKYYIKRKLNILHKYIQTLFFPGIITSVPRNIEHGGSYTSQLTCRQPIRKQFLSCLEIPCIIERSGNGSTLQL